MEKRIEDFIIYSLYGILLAALVFMVFDNIDSPWKLLILSGLFLSLFTARYLLYKNIRNCFIDIILLIEIMVVFVIGLADKSSSHMVFYLCIIIDVVLRRSKLIGFAAFVLCYVMYTVELFVKLNQLAAWSITLKAAYSMLSYAAAYVFAIILRFVIQQYTELSKVTAELKVKTLEQQWTYDKLKRANVELEELAVLKERNRLAREIHDTIGHRLTTAIIEAEAGKTIYGREPDKALEKFILAQEQVKTCLEEVRISVRTLRDKEYIDYNKSIITLIEDVQKNTGLNIKYEIDDLNNTADAVKRVLLRVIQECITNSLRHGNSTVIVISLKKNEKGIQLVVEDNGKGCVCVVKGFGLQSMEERIAEIGGKLYIESEEDEGFTVKIAIPEKSVGVVNE